MCPYNSNETAIAETAVAVPDDDCLPHRWCREWHTHLNDGDDDDDSNVYSNVVNDLNIE